MALEVIRLVSDHDMSSEEAWRWHARPGALGRLIPPWEPVTVVDAPPGLAEGTRVTVRLELGPVGMDWVSEHLAPDPPRSFADFQVEGPFAQWRHRHLFADLPAGGCSMEDRVEYELPLAPIAGLLTGAQVEDRIRRGLAYRHRVLRRDSAVHRRAGLPEGQRIAVSGASGMVGSALCDLLGTGGHEVVALTRPGSEPPPSVSARCDWDPAQGAIEAEGLDDLDAVVHLAGEPIAGGRWTAQRKARILESRVKGTRLIAEAIAGLERPPRVLVCASAIGFYGDRGTARLDEDAGPGDGFLADVVQQWEAAADVARAAGVRVVHLRFGIVLWPGGGALERLLLPMRAGVGGRLGKGDQVWSWVTLDDVIGSVLHSIGTETLQGPVNVVAPGPVTNAEFVETLAAVLRRPALLPVPAPALRAALGAEMADELLLASARIEPARLADSGFRFSDPELEPALRHLLGRYPRR